MSISRGWERGETSAARAASVSVVSPMADTTPTTGRPVSCIATMRRETLRILSVSATELPPNFMTLTRAASAGAGAVEASILGKSLVGGPSGHGRQDALDVGHRRARVDDCEACAGLAVVAGGRHEGIALGQQALRPVEIVLRTPADPPEHEHGQLRLDQQLEVGPAPDLLRALPRDLQRRLDRLAVGVPAVRCERE